MEKYTTPWSLIHETGHDLKDRKVEMSGPKKKKTKIK